MRRRDCTSLVAYLTGLLGVVTHFAYTPLARADEPKTLASGLVNPESVCIGPGNRIFVTVIGEFDKDGDGAVLVLEEGKVRTFVGGLNDPKGITAFQKWLYVTDKNRLLRIDTAAKTPQAEVFVPADKFPEKPQFLNDVTVDAENGTIYVSDSGDLMGGGGAVYRVHPQTRAVSTVISTKKFPALKTPNGLVNDGTSFLLVADFHTGEIFRVKLADGSAEKIAEGIPGADGLAWDHHGRLYASSWEKGQVFVIPRPGAKPVLLSDKFKAAADICYDPERKVILVPDMTAGTVVAIPAQVPNEPVDETPLALRVEVAFPQLQISGWTPETPDGRPNPLRPIVLTHAGDGSGRLYLATQQGVVHAFPNDPKAIRTEIVLDIQDRVQYDDRTNEEGLLGLAFHPRFAENGELYVFYTPKRHKPNEEMRNRVVRFRRDAKDPARFDPHSEELILEFRNRPFWNHDGGTILFGPDGYLYIVHGDGGSANDPFDHGQNLQTLFGKILRIDVNRRDGQRPYAIPPDNPFVGRRDALPEIYAYGLRNPWRIAFDKQTGQLWCGDVGQNLYEEINLIVKGGNYGWNRREGLHPFGPHGSGPKPQYIDPIWEYHHDVGKSITGGAVYRGKLLPELQGYYLYADYVSSRVWALKYDDKLGRVIANRPLPDPKKPVLSFGEDESGELYMLVLAPDGRGIYRFSR
ncbi:MAG: PQQ-dependent sugar dehydrogenase [Gemmataceae bacterium]|nr:PQQ-dependent sugar dehydrogenase [Gemmataceae bacterium]MDW8242253.1 PQQ-dependent sugar dehydrogenase [Thermogemmata sp.]